ncbi:MAG: class I SAM-dependent methyltransferase [Leptolyngbya sp. SIO1E4]|nr:class I SAM-dependent methyltransferase [Leptolyngbya sp. SIO1E4]
MWNHNTHFHNYLLRQLPIKVNHALDVGCGLGLFAYKLAGRANGVHALDVNGTVLSEAASCHTAPNIHYLHTDFLEADLPAAAYDVIVSIASLHHMDLETALEKMRALLRPSGTLLILGLYREATVADYLYSAISVPINRICLIRHQSSRSTSAIVAPTCPATLSLRQIKTVASTVLPGFSLKRHLFWRYSLIWHKSINS